MPRFQTYSWSIGTTSFRVKELAYRLERQLQLLSELHRDNPGETWTAANHELQTRYYNLLAKNDLVLPNANNKPKDAREKTSSLVDLGLITEKREVTEVGHKLLAISKHESSFVNAENLFGVDGVSFVYLKQLLKFMPSQIKIQPFIMMLYAIDKLAYLTDQEFAYLLPICRDRDGLIGMIDQIRELRAGKVTVPEIIRGSMKARANYCEAEGIFLAASQVDQSLTMKVGLNRKSPSYDMPYAELYRALNIFNFADQSDQAIKNVKNAVQGVTGKARSKWKALLFSGVRSWEEQVNYFRSTWPSLDLSVMDETSFRRAFFWRMHEYKWRSNLEEYADLNRRFFNLSGIVIFADGKIELELFAKHFFKQCIDKVIEHPINSRLLPLDVDLEDISPYFAVPADDVYSSISIETGVSADSMSVHSYIKDEKKKRFDRLIDEKFSLVELIKILDKITSRDDSNVQALVTEDADIPTIFEYILGICWYEISQRSFDILQAFNLSLDASMLPIQHARGGAGDLSINFDKTNDYPKHAVVMEATLSNGSQQRNQEYEPVIRHLAAEVVKSYPDDAYCVFVSTNLDPNLVIDFRSKKANPEHWGTHLIERMKIIPIDVALVKYLLRNDIHYGSVYKFFEKAYASDVPIAQWYMAEIENKYQALV